MRPASTNHGLFTDREETQHVNAQLNRRGSVWLENTSSTFSRHQNYYVINIITSSMLLRHQHYYDVKLSQGMGRQRNSEEKIKNDDEKPASKTEIPGK